jgi:predicted ATPase
VDVIEFEACLAGPNPTVTQLERAAALYRGAFLDDFYLRDAPLFEDWMRPLQERYRQMAMKAIYSLVIHHKEHRQYSTAINFTNRLLALEPWMEEAYRQLMFLFAVSGQRTLALAQYELCQKLLWEELGVEPSAETEALYEQIRDGAILPEPQSAPSTPSPAIVVKPIQIPAVVDHFVGRSAIIKSIVTELSADERNSIQALIGMGGVGKSTLAVQVARAVQEEFPDGILWANVSSSEPMAVLEGWAAAYGYDFTRIADLESTAAAFRGVLAEKRVLIVLDDVVGEAKIRPLLPGGNRCRVLITTRNQDLAQALNAQVWPVNELSPDNGRLLLSSILGEARVAAEPVAADTICSLLQNLPLAVEITAQRLKSRPRRLLKDMAQRLRDETQRLSLLEISDQAVRASFQVSWDALDTERRRVFALIGLFNGRFFTADAMAHIAEMKRFPVEDRLFDLINLSLLRAEGERLYYQHPLLADFAREKLGEDLAVGNGRFSTYYLNFAQQNQNNFDTIRTEWDNLKAGLKITYNSQKWPEVIGYAQAIRDFCFRQGRFSRARQAYQMAYEAALTLEDTANAA